MSLSVRNDTLAALAGTDGDYAPLQVNASGALYIQEGAALDVSGATLTVNAHAVTNAGTFVVQEDGAALTALQLIDDTVAVLGTATYTEATTKGNVIGVVRNDTLAALADTDNEIAPLQVNASGALYIQEGAALDVSAATLTVNAHAVTNAGTFAVQSTLQAGTAEFGKLAAGSAEIGNVKNSGTFATQATLQAGTAAFGKLSANSGVDIGDVDVTSIAAGTTLIGDVGIGVRTSGGIPIDSVYYDADLDEAAIAAKAAAGQLYFIHAMNTTAAPLFLQLYNVAQGSVTVGTTVPDMQFVVPGNADSDGAGFVINFSTPIDFDVAITVACSTDSEGNNAPGAGACIVNIGIN